MYQGLIDYEEHTWSATILLCDRAYQYSDATTYVFADSALCLGVIKDNPNEAWKEKIKWYFESKHFKELNRIDGMQTEFEWEISRRWTSSKRFKVPMRDLQCEPEHFKDRIIMSMHNDIGWKAEGNTERCEYNSQTVAEYARRFPCDKFRSDLCFKTEPPRGFDL